MRFNRSVVLLSILTSLVLAAGCGPRKSPREIELGSRAEDTPSPSASVAASTGDMANAFPSIALDYPPPGETPGIDAAETAVATDPKSGTAALNLGYAYYKAAAYDQAAAAFEKAAALAPVKPEPLLYRALTAMGEGDLSKALIFLNKASALPKVMPETQSLIFLQRGNIYFQQQKDAEAKSAFEKSVALNPKQGAARIALGAFAAMKKEPAKAKTLFTQAVKDLPSSRIRGKGYASLGLLAEQAGNKADAKANYEKALADDANNSAAKTGLKRLK